MERKTLVFNMQAYLEAKAAAGFRSDAELASVLALSRSRLSTILSGAVPSPASRKEIARALAVRETSLWVAVDLGARK